jgi:hypothetical protein
VWAQLQSRAHQPKQETSFVDLGPPYGQGDAFHENQIASLAVAAVDDLLFPRERKTLNLKRLQERVRKANVTSMSDGERKEEYFVPKLLPIDPNKTPLTVTQAHLLLYLWQQDLIEVGPQESPQAWDFLKKFLRIYDLSERKEKADNSKLLELLDELRIHYHDPDDWRGLLKYAAAVKKTISRRSRESPFVPLGQPDQVDVSGALSRLPKKYREIASLLYEGKSESEVCTRLGLSEDDLKACKQQIRELLAVRRGESEPKENGLEN